MRILFYILVNDMVPFLFIFFVIWFSFTGAYFVANNANVISRPPPITCSSSNTSAPSYLSDSYLYVFALVPHTNTVSCMVVCVRCYYPSMSQVLALVCMDINCIHITAAHSSFSQFYSSLVIGLEQGMAPDFTIRPIFSGTFKWVVDI